MVEPKGLWGSRAAVYQIGSEKSVPNYSDLPWGHLMANRYAIRSDNKGLCETSAK